MAESVTLPELTKEEVIGAVTSMFRAGETLDNVNLCNEMRGRITELLIKTLGDKAMEELTTWPEERKRILGINY